VTTPFDAALAAIATARYHNHRLEAHSDIVSDGIVADLQATCAPFRSDLESGIIKIWKNVASPGDRELNIPDQVHKFYRDRDDEFDADVLPRLSSGDESLFADFA
jgi:hypothetical protein